MKKLDVEIENEIIKYYIEYFYSCRKISKDLGISGATVLNVLKRNGIPTRTKGGIYELPTSLLVQKYREGVSIIQLSKEYQVCVQTIANYLAKAEINLNNIYYNKKLDRNYFDKIDTYDKAYYLGFLISDGSVGTSTNKIDLTLKKSDSYILDVLSSKINNTNPIYFSKRGEASLTFKSKEIKNALAKYGVIPNKTFKTYLPELEMSLMPHLIRGLIDGDGWVSFKSHAIGFCGSVELVGQVRDFLVKILGVFPVKIIEHSSICQVNWASKNGIIKIGNYIYKDKQDCFLHRKFNNFMKIPR